MAFKPEGEWATFGIGRVFFLIPLFLLWVYLNLWDTYLGLILAYGVTSFVRARPYPRPWA